MCVRHFYRLSRNFFQFSPVKDSFKRGRIVPSASEVLISHIIFNDEMPYRVKLGSKMAERDFSPRHGVATVFPTLLECSLVVRSSPLVLKCRPTVLHKRFSCQGGFTVD